MGNSRPRRIAILCPASASWVAPALGGFRRYAYKQQGWLLFSSPLGPHGQEDLSLSLRSMRGWKGDGILTASTDKEGLCRLRDMKIPAVNLAAALADPLGVPRVLVDNFRAGRMAADHFLSNGLRHLAFFGWEDAWYSERRQFGFQERAEQSGATCGSLLQPWPLHARQDWQEQINAIRKWMSSLPRPVGVFAVSDYRAQLVIEAAHEAALRIPEDIAIAGMDNDETICEYSVPNLTSISRNPEQVGLAAAALLDRMMNGEPPPADDVLLEPDGIVARQSTEMMYSSDPVAQRALDYMRAHLKAQFNVAQLAEHLGVAKRTLEVRFRENLGSSPHDFLTRLRVQHAQVLMQMPQKRTMEQIAVETGMGTIPAFYAAFRRITNESPGDFRKRQLARFSRFSSG